MRITQRFCDDHAQMRSLLNEIERRSENSEPESAEAFAQTLVEKWSAHAWAEEAVLFPALARAVKEAAILDAPDLGRLERDHRLLERIVVRLKDQLIARPRPAYWPATYQEARRGLESHFGREEQTLFTLSESLTDTEALSRALDRALTSRERG